MLLVIVLLVIIRLIEFVFDVVLKDYKFVFFVLGVNEM